MYILLYAILIYHTYTIHTCTSTPTASLVPVQGSDEDEPLLLHIRGQHQAHSVRYHHPGNVLILLSICVCVPMQVVYP